MRVEILIRQKREEKGYTIDKLAKLAGMSKGHLSRIKEEKQIQLLLLCQE